METFTYKLPVEQAERQPVSPAVDALQAVLMNDSWVEAVGRGDSIASMRQELADVLADPERLEQLEQAFAVWGDCRGSRNARVYFTDPDGNVPEMVHSGVLHCFANAAIPGKDRFKFQSIQSFIDMSMVAKSVLDGEASDSSHVSQPMGRVEWLLDGNLAQKREEIVDTKGGKKVLVKKADWVLIARQGAEDSALQLITAIPGYNDRRFNKLVQKEQQKQSA